MYKKKGKYYLESNDITAINKTLKNMEYPFNDAEVGERITSGGQAAVYALNTKSGSSEYVIKVSEEDFERIINFNNEFNDYCKKLVNNDKEKISDLYLKNERNFLVPIESGTENDQIYCIIEKKHLCLNGYNATGLNPFKDDMEIAIRLGVDLFTLLNVMSSMSNPFVHRDIKPANIFFKTDNISDGFCLGDFGIVTQLLDGTLITQIKDLGTIQTASPDIFLHDEYHSIFSGSKKADMYSLAATMYYYLNDREYPFIDKKTPDGVLDSQYWEDIRKKGCKMPKHGSQKLKEIVCKALSFNPKDRFTDCREILEELKKTDEYKNLIINPIGIDETIGIKNPTQNKPKKFLISLEKGPSNGELSGKRLDGRYEMKEVIGIGSMAEIYKAYDNIDDKTVAVKILKKEYLSNKEFCRRFKDKSKAIVVLSHPNIVSVYNVSYGDRLHYVVMQYVEGITLKEYIEQKGKIGTEESVLIIEQILHALCHAHEKGIVHESINSRNIMLRSDGNIKMTDFCMPCSDNNDASDKRDDIFSVGMILYKMLTGLKFFANTDNPVPRKVDSSIPVGLEQITMRALEKNKNCRYQSAADMLLDIEKYKQNHEIQFAYHYNTQNSPLVTPPVKPPVKRKMHRVLKAVLGVAAIAAILTVCAFLLVKQPPETTKEKYYNEAASFAESGDNVNAAIYYGKAKDYKDAKEKSFALWDEIAFRETVSAGPHHTVNINADGTVSAVGYAEHGQCNTDGLSDIIAVSAGALHTAGIKSDGTVVAIGSNQEGQCNVDNWTDIVSVSSGDYHTVGLEADGTVVAVGNNEYRQLNVHGWENIVSVSAGDNHTVALKSNGTVVATGWNEFGQCDVDNWKYIVAVSAGDYNTVGLKSDGTIVVAGNNFYGQEDVNDWKDIVAVSASDYHVTALKSDGTVVAAGFDENGQCDVSSWTDIVAVSSGGYYTVGLKSDGTVVSVGKNDYGQRDVDNWRNIYFSYLQNKFSVRETVSAGNYHTVALKSDGTVFAVGSNQDGPCDVNGWKDIIAVSANGEHTVGLKSDGTVIAVGSNEYGQYNNVSGWKDIITVSAGDHHTVGLKSDGTVVSVGNNDYGQCDVAEWSNIVAVFAGRLHTVGLKSDGTVVAAGLNEHGQCGVSGWTDIIAVSAGDNHTVALKSDGTVVAVGNNKDGQCNVTEWTDIVAVYAGYYHTVGLKSDGTVVSVGNNEYGQCDVTDWSDIVAVSANAYHTVGLKSDGTVVATGHDSDGRCDVDGWKNIMIPEKNNIFKQKN